MFPVLVQTFLDNPDLENKEKEGKKSDSHSPCQKAETCGLYYKTFGIIIYDRNDTSHYYKTTIVDYDRS